MDYYIRLNYLWYENGKEKDLVPIVENMGAEIIRQTPMRGLGTTKTWYKVLHVKAKKKHIELLSKYISKPGEDMLVRPYEVEKHLTPTKVYG